MRELYGNIMIILLNNNIYDGQVIIILYNHNSTEKLNVIRPSRSIQVLHQHIFYDFGTSPPPSVSTEHKASCWMYIHSKMLKHVVY